MTSKERVSRAIHFNSPDKIPVFLLDGKENDIMFLWPDSRPYIKQPWTEVGENTYEYINQWGSLYRRFGTDGNGEVIKPALADIEDYKAYQLPDMFHAGVYSYYTDKLEKNKDKYKLCVLAAGSLFEAAHTIRGLDNFLIDLYEEPEFVCDLLDRFVKAIKSSIDAAVEMGADGVFGFDDWGIQDRLLISMDMWHEYFRDRYKDCWAYAHSKGLDVWMHSCGYTLPVLIEWQKIGLNVAQLDQQENMTLEALDEKLGGKLAFFCPVDIQAVMPKSTPDQIREYVHRMFGTVGNHNGGLIGKTYASPDVVEHTKENLDEMHRAFREDCNY